MNAAPTTEGDSSVRDRGLEVRIRFPPAASLVRGLELDAGYVDTIVRRWQTLTGGTACHAASGRSFDGLAREAEATNAA